jgi:hypothetical protein
LPAMSEFPMPSPSRPEERIFKALGLPSGSEVVLPAYEDMSVPGAVREAGLIPVFADIDPLTLNTDPSRLAEKLTDRTSAVIVAHLFGVPVDTAKVRSSIGGRNILFIEDCAHAVGSRIEGRHVGHEGDLAFFSFNTTKPFNCFGGGMIVTRDAKIHRVLRGFFDGSSSPGSVGVLRKILRGYLLFLFSRCCVCSRGTTSSCWFFTSECSSVPSPGSLFRNYPTFRH